MQERQQPGKEERAPVFRGRMRRRRRRRKDRGGERTGFRPGGNLTDVTKWKPSKSDINATFPGYVFMKAAGQTDIYK